MTFSSVFFVFYLVCVPLWAQSVGLVETKLDKTLTSLEFNDASLKTVFQIFTQKTGVNFILSDLVKNRKLSLYLEEVTVRQALQSISKANDLEISLIEGTSVFKVDLALEEDKIDQRVTKIYHLKFTTVSSLLDNSFLAEQTLEDFGGEEGAGAGGGSSNDLSSGSDTGSSSQGGNIMKVIKELLSSEGRMTPDLRTNSIIVTDLPEVIERIDVVVRALDTSIRQVLIRVELVEISKSLSDILGVSYGTDPVVGDLLGLFADPVMKEEAPFRSSSLVPDLVTLSYSRFAILMRALSSSTDTSFLARPRVMTLDNEPAVVDLTSNTAIHRDVLESQHGTTTTSFQRTQTGIILWVLPHINNDDEVTLLIKPRVTTVRPSSTFSDALDPVKRSVTTKVRLKEGETISIGGLVSNEEDLTVRGLPILSKLPFVGAAFRNKAETNRRTELLIFITPFIVDGSNISYLNKDKKNGYLATTVESVPASQDAKVDTASSTVSLQADVVEKKEWGGLQDKIETYELMLRQHPDDVSLMNRLAVQYSRMQRYDDAIDVLRRAVMIDPRSSSSYNNLGNIYRLMNQYDDAILYFKKSIQINPDHPYAYTSLGLCYEMKGAYKDARRSYEDAVLYAPDSPWTQTAQERLSLFSESGVT